MTFKILTLFPEFYACLKSGIIGKAIERGLFGVEIVNIRDYSEDKHKRCDDYPFGGGAGMVMTPDPIHKAICAVDPEHKARRIFMSPRGQVLTQKKVKELSSGEEILFLCGSYEGVDQRVVDMDIDEELSIGDYVLTSGDPAALVTLNSVVRYVPGVLGSEQSTEEESFSTNLLEYPQYTRPQNYMGMEVPEVLVSGNHGLVDKWRYEKALEITKKRRPDLLEKEGE
ncbi:MAG: tRNA (guanosine(37)-N1)-methyltransferase TrmD [Eubacteriales bacterium]|nr:tRNA (guanosine(37)-N1)-methyltransferase TrmD [Eubacteriales bacterium]MDY6151040.1 tRNA (guanosine(37)-N1)-methyltransferase TrmD [Eubacteriales bacterium]